MFEDKITMSMQIDYQYMGSMSTIIIRTIKGISRATLYRNQMDKMAKVTKEITIKTKTLMRNTNSSIKIKNQTNRSLILNPSNLRRGRNPT